MAQNRTRKIVVTGVLGAITVILGFTHWGFIPWGLASFSIMQVPTIIGAILEGPIVGGVIGLIFGLFSMYQAAVGPTGPLDPLFVNPLLSVLPRILIGPMAWLAWNGLKKWPVVGMIVSGIVGSLTNTVLVLGMLGLVFGTSAQVISVLGANIWKTLWGVAIANGLPEAGISAVVVVIVVAAVRQIKIGKKQGADL
ncbi:MAG: ECF transporter S component [Anaerolinea sp.]|nr:ECF transporter S component [Anaerolinea sp.]